MAEVTITWNAAQWKAAAMPAIDAGLTAAAAVMANQATDDLAAGKYPPASSPGSAPAMDTGELHRSIAFASPEALGTPGHAAFGTAIPHGRYLEFGAHIVAKKGKYLKIPVDRRLARKVEMTGAKLILIKNKAKNQAVLVLASALSVWRGKRTSPTGRGGSFKLPAGSVVYVLKRSVTIHPRPWIVRAALKARPQAGNAFALTTKRLLKAGGLSH